MLVGGSRIHIQPRAMYVALGDTEHEFKASNGWLEKFKRCHNIHSITMIRGNRLPKVNLSE